jgi:hypothetical protein
VGIVVDGRERGGCAGSLRKVFKKRKRSITSITMLRLRMLRCDGCVMLVQKKHHKLTVLQRLAECVIWKILKERRFL